MYLKLQLGSGILTEWMPILCTEFLEVQKTEIALSWILFCRLQSQVITVDDLR